MIEIIVVVIEGQLRSRTRRSSNCWKLSRPAIVGEDALGALHTAGGHQLVASPPAKGTLATWSLDSIFDDFLVQF